MPRVQHVAVRTCAKEGGDMRRHVYEWSSLKQQKTRSISIFYGLRFARSPPLSQQREKRIRP